MLSFLVAFSFLATPVTAADAKTLGRSVELTVAVGVDGIGARFDADRFLDRALAGLDLPKDLEAGFRKGFTSKAGQLGAGVVSQVQSGGRLTFKKVVMLDGAPAAQLRLLTRGNGFEIIELRVTRGDDGSVRIDDLYELSSGELKSQEIRRLALATVSELKRGLIDRLLGSERVFVDNLPKFKELSGAMQAGRFADAVAVYKTVPKELQKERFIQRMYVLALGGLATSEPGEKADAAYQRAMKQYLTLFPDDASSHALGLDYYFLQKRWADFDRSVDIVEKRVDADEAWFEMLRGFAAQARGDKDAARGHFEGAIAREATMPLAYAMLLDLHLAAGAWAEVARWLGAFEAEADADIDAVLELPGYADFLASKEGKAFVKKRKAAAKKPAAHP